MKVGRTVAETPVAEKLAALTALSTPGVIRLEPSISALAASLSRRALGGWRSGGNGALPLTAGVRADILDGAVTVEVALAIELGRPVPEVAADAQSRSRTPCASWVDSQSPPSRFWSSTSTGAKG